jgi:hypothetical protein
MLRTITIVLAVAMLPFATTVDAQGRGNGNQRRDAARAQGVPPGQMPPNGMCRVWYDGRPNGRQPSATSCRQAEAIAARDRNARVIYAADVYDQYGYDRNGGIWGNVPGTYPYPDNDRGVNRVPGRSRDPRVATDPYYSSRDPYYTRNGDTAYENGYRDGREKGLEDGRDSDRFDPTGESRYRSADRGYIDSYGDKNRYKDVYREGFRAGYEEAYRTANYRR